MLTTIILSFGECYTQMSYIFRGGFRLVTPYLYAIRRGVKLDWMGRKINEVCLALLTASLPTKADLWPC